MNRREMISLRFCAFKFRIQYLIFEFQILKIFSTNLYLSIVIRGDYLEARLIKRTEKLELNFNIGFGRVVLSRISTNKTIMESFMQFHVLQSIPSCNSVQVE